MKLSNIFLVPALVVTSTVLNAQQQSFGIGSNTAEIFHPYAGTYDKRIDHDTINLGNDVKYIDCWISSIHTLNSDFPEYTPVVAHDVHMMFFTGRRKDNVGNRKQIDSKYKAEDIYYSIKDAKGNWGEEIPVAGNINTSKNEAITWISADGKKMILCQNEDLFECFLENGLWSKPEPMKAINSPYRETHASYSPDGNTIFFTTDNPELAGVGGLDILMIKKDQSSGNWGKPTLVEEVNSPLNEDDPTLLNDGKSFYFSSQGFNSLGGYDIFKTDFSKGKFSKPENMGFPINTTANEPFISFSEDHSRAFLSSDRGDKNEQNIYEVVFPAYLKLPLLVEVYDSETKELLNSNATLVNMGSNGDIYMDNSTRGIFNAEGIGMNSQFELMVESKDHESQQITISTSGIGPFDPDTFRLVQKVYLDPKKDDNLISKDDLNKKVYFDYARSVLKPDAISTLETVKTFLESHPDTKAVISAHTDSRGTGESNLVLSDKRGANVIKWLVKHGIDTNRIVMSSHGEEKPFTDNLTEDNRSKNRRVEIEIVFN